MGHKALDVVHENQGSIDRTVDMIVEGLRETARYARSTRPIAATLLLVALVTLLGRPYTVLLPVFAAEVLHGGPPSSHG